MKISSRIEGSIHGAILSSRPSPAVVSPASLRLTRSYHGGSRPASSLLSAHFARIPFSKFFAFRPHSEFFTTNISASSAVASADEAPSANSSPVTSPPLDLDSKISQPKDEVLGLVDQYDDTTVEEHLEFLRDPYLRRYAPDDGPHLTVSDREEDVFMQSVGHSRRRDLRDMEAVRQLREAVLTKLKRPSHMDLDTIYELYQEIPEPRMSHVSARLRHQLLATLGKAEKKDSKGMLRYFAVIADVKNSAFSLLLSEWNTAISFASRYVGKTSDVEVEAALQLWREMEQSAGVKGSDVTFNILFDAASKAGKFSLAEMIYQEMTTRGFAFNRYHHVSLIHFFGLKEDTGGVRAAYRQMVEAGEIIDSVVLNCVISSFLRTGEEESAESVYKRMKAYNRDLPVMPQRNYATQKSITKVLMMFAKIGKTHPEMRQQFQRSALLSPDLQTYRLLISHYAIRVGNLAKVAAYLDEMKFFRVPLHGAIFLSLFKGFQLHGPSKPDWSLQRLDSVWGALLGALDAGTHDLHITTWLAMAVLEAFSRHLPRDEMLDIYENMRSRWNLDLTDSQFMLSFFNRLLQQRGLRV
ncbi:hypothetical protein F4778DRAFT_742927 [Xylariomycetidae sp. FL2044]|nr:hypothetical protein F4778DRAFT_742927 [Xylariomycetidae sp. FL2044]